MNENEREMLEKRKALYELCNKYKMCAEGCPLASVDFQCGRGKYFTNPVGDSTYMPDDEINAAYAVAFPDAAPCIKDSGERREFETGAVRDIQEGKGRCDLMPLNVAAWVLGGKTEIVDEVLREIQLFKVNGDGIYLIRALRNFSGYENIQTMLLEVSKHFEEGAKKYGENNWQKGIPVNCYINSAVRHYLKWLRGDTDEYHDRAFCWNIIAACWTCLSKPELNPYGSGMAKRSENVFSDEQEV